MIQENIVSIDMTDICYITLYYIILYNIKDIASYNMTSYKCMIVYIS